MVRYVSVNYIYLMYLAYMSIGYLKSLHQVVQGACCLVPSLIHCTHHGMAVQDSVDEHCCFFEFDGLGDTHVFFVIGAMPNSLGFDRGIPQAHLIQHPCGLPLI